MYLTKILASWCLIIKATEATNGELVVSGCSASIQCPIIRASCVQIKGFNDSNFAANNIYCNTESADVYSTVHIDNKQRYELRSQEGGRWNLVRVTKTKRDVVETQLYAGTRGSPTRPLNFTLTPLSLDNTVSPIDVFAVDVPESYLRSRQVLNEFRSGNLDACQLSACDSIISPMLLLEKNDELCFQAAELSAALANEVGNTKLSATRLETGRTCTRTVINAKISKQQSIPRNLRWLVAESSLQMATAFTKSGMIQAAIDATLVGLATSPLQRQRRALYITLGDLRLAAKETKAAYNAYVHALKVVRLKGGAVEKESFLQSFEGSVGDFIGQVVNNNSRTSDLAFAIPSNYSKARISLILHAEKDDEHDTTWHDMPELSSVANPLTSFGRDCDLELDETSFDFCHSVVIN